MKKYCIFLVLLLILCRAAWAAPTISGVAGPLQDGGSLTISGSNFSAKTSAPPFVWDNFESGGDGENPVGEYPTIPADANAWSNIFVGCDPEYSSDVTRDGSSMSLLLDLEQPSGGGACSGRVLMQENNISLSAGDKLYFTYWQYYTEQGTIGQAKGPRVLYYVGGYNDYFNTHTTLQYEEWNWQWQCLYDSTQASGSPDTISQQPARGKWHRWEFQSQLSSAPLTADGKMKMQISRDDFSGAISVEADVSNLITIPTGEETWDSFWLGQWIMGTPMTAQFYFDDVYFDTSWNRVEIGDAAVYANCTHREIQIPTAWAAGEITATLNIGSFAEDASVYFFVVDSDGAVSDGYPITLGKSVILSGTAIAGGVTETEIAAGGETIIFTVTGDTFAPTLGEDNAITTAFLAGCDGSGAEAGGWDAQVKPALSYTMLTLDSTTQATLVLPVVAGYNITENESIGWIIPASALVASEDPITASPSVSVISVILEDVTHPTMGHSTTGPSIGYSATGRQIVGP